MKIHTEQRNVSATGIMATEEFTVQATGHMMEILSGLYSDIPWAIVREYGTNMLDGYFALPKGAKVIAPEVHLPTSIEPYIEFKDYGVGMDFETVWKVYKTYGASTKTGSNDEVGGFGLGAKTAFCYDGCDQWTVESRKDGKRMVFSATRNEKGVPSMFHVATLETDEPNGVTVRIPVAPRDFATFKKAAERLVQFYPMPIKVTGDKDFSTEQHEYVLRGKNWGLRKGRGDSQLIMGNVPYPLVMHHVFSKYRDMDQMIGSNYYGYALDVWVPIGEVDIVPSREALKYTDRTVTRLGTAIQQFYDEVGGIAGELLKDQKTEWDAIKFIVATLGSQLTRYLKKLEWNGKKIDATRGLVINVDAIRKKIPGFTVEFFNGHSAQTAVSRTSYVKGEAIISPLTERQWIFMDDLGRGMITRVREFLNTEGSKIYGSNMGIVLKGEGLTEAKAREILGGAPMQLVSSIPAPVREKVERKKNVATVKRLSERGHWMDEDVDIDEGGYFIRMSAQGLCDLNDGYFSDFLRTLEKHGIVKKDTQVYGIPRQRKTIETKDGWVDLVKEIKPKIQAFVNKHAQDVFDVTAWESTMNSGAFGLMSKSKPSTFEDGSLAHEIATEAQRIRSIKSTADDALKLSRLFMVSLPSGKIRTYDYSARLKKEYPMLALLNSRCYYTNFNGDEPVVISYINSMDKAR